MTGWKQLNLHEGMARKGMKNEWTVSKARYEENKKACERREVQGETQRVSWFVCNADANFPCLTRVQFQKYPRKGLKEKSLLSLIFSSQRTVSFQFVCTRSSHESHFFFQVEIYTCGLTGIIFRGKKKGSYNCTKGVSENEIPFPLTRCYFPISGSNRMGSGRRGSLDNFRLFRTTAKLVLEWVIPAIYPS